VTVSGWTMTEAGNFRKAGILVRECADGWEWLWPDEDHQPDEKTYDTAEAAMAAADVALDGSR
jgi:hypothetical protein